MSSAAVHGFHLCRWRPAWSSVRPRPCPRCFLRLLCSCAEGQRQAPHPLDPAPMLPPAAGHAEQSQQGPLLTVCSAAEQPPEAAQALARPHTPDLGSERVGGTPAEVALVAAAPPPSRLGALSLLLNSTFIQHGCMSGKRRGTGDCGRTGSHATRHLMRAGAKSSHVTSKAR